LLIVGAKASYLMIWVGILGIVGRLVASWMSDALGRCPSGFLIGIGGAVATALAGYGTTSTSVRCPYSSC
jgi:hypothetical protein